MRKKAKALKAVEPNAGVRKAYTKAVTKIEHDFQSYVLNRVLLFLESKHVLAEDSELTAKTPEERQKEKLLKRKILTEVAKAHPEMLKADVERFVSQNMGAWSALLATASRATVTRFIKAIAGSASAAQRQAFIAGKVTKGIIDKVFQNSIPTVQTRYISSRAMAGLADAVKDNVGLITKIGADDVARLSDVLLNGLQNGLDYNQIKDELRNTEGFTDKRVETVCRDQVAKITTKVQTDNAIEAGFNEAIWVHVPGTYTSRVSHIHMDGKRFRLDEGLYDEAVGYNVMPGELINCLPGDVNVTFFNGITKIFRHFYTGELTVIETDSLKPLPITPNHPVLTIKGWVPANALKVGDYLITAVGEGSSIFTSNSDYRVATFSQLFEAFSLAGGDATISSCVKGEFHGDVTDSKVEIIDVNGFLSDGFKAGGAESVIEFIFTRPDSAKISLPRLCFTRGGDRAVMTTLACLMCGCNQRLALLARHLSEPYIVSLGAVAAFYATFGELPRYNVSRDSIFFCDSLAGHSGEIITNSGIAIEPGRPHVLKQAESLKPYSKVRGGEIDCSGSGFSSGTATNKIVCVKNIGCRSFNSHVYNLETISGWYSPDYYITHNCRCVYRLVVPEDLQND